MPQFDLIKFVQIANEFGIDIYQYYLDQANKCVVFILAQDSPIRIADKFILLHTLWEKYVLDKQDLYYLLNKNVTFRLYCSKLVAYKSLSVWEKIASNQLDKFISYLKEQNYTAKQCNFSLKSNNIDIEHIQVDLMIERSMYIELFNILYMLELTINKE